MSLRSDLHHDGDRCQYCGRPLSRARIMFREQIHVREGEYANHRGTALIVECSCGIPSPIVWELEPAA